MHLLLQEWRPRLVRLPRVDLQILLEQYAHALEVLPSFRHGVYRVTPRSFVGMFSTPHFLWELQPKLRLNNMIALMDLSLEDEAATRSHRRVRPIYLLDWLSRRLAQAMRLQGQRGLAHGYREQPTHSAYIRGRLDVATQLRQIDPVKPGFHCVADQWTVNILVNQLPKTVATLLLDQPTLSEETQDSLRAALRAFTAVEMLTEPHLPRSQPILPEGYATLWELTHWLACCLGMRPGTVRLPGFLLPMAYVFERYVTRTVEQLGQDDPKLGVEVQRSIALQGPPSEPPLLLRPDIRLQVEGLTKLVVEIKWKDRAKQPSPADLHQILAYGQLSACPDLRLIYPAKQNHRQIYRIPHRETTVTIHGMRISGSLQACAAARRQLQRRLRAAVG